MFYQFNPHGDEWGNMSWGHATSKDLARWQEQPTALLNDDRQMIFSGSAVIDHGNTAGFGAGAMVAIYTGATVGEDQHQWQSLASSIDHGSTWTYFLGNPVLDRKLADFRDPSVFWHEPSQQWIMVVALSTENAALIFASPDLKTWRETGRIEAGSAPGQIWECPALIELPVAGTDIRKWMFKVDALNDAPGSGALYQIGQFDGRKFIPDDGTWHVVDHGSDFYAAIPWNGPRDELGHPAWISWMGNHAYQHDFPQKDWRGTMSIPRRMGLAEVAGRYRLTQTVEPSVQGLFAPETTVDAHETTIGAACRIDVGPNFSGTLQIEHAPGCFIAVTCQNETIAIQREDAQLGFLSCERTITSSRRQGMSLYFDSETCEILSHDGTIAASFQHRPSRDQLTLRCDNYRELSVAPLR